MEIIKELDNKVDYREKVKVEMTLAELMAINMVFGRTSTKDRAEFYDESLTLRKEHREEVKDIDLNSDLISELYNVTTEYFNERGATFE